MLNNIKEITGDLRAYKDGEKWFELLPNGFTHWISEESIKSYLVGCIHLGHTIKTKGGVLYVS